MNHRYSIYPVAFLALLFVFSGCTKKPQTVAGKIELSTLLERIPIQPGAALFLIARTAGQQGGPPVAVKRFTPPFRFPIEFTLSAQDAMMPDTPFDGPLEISARLSQSGSASPAAKGDFEGVAQASPVIVGTKDVEVRLAQLRQ